MPPVAIPLTISFPGIESVQSVVATDRHGITPSFFVLNVLPQASIPAQLGDLAIGSGANVRIWRDCLVDAGTATFDQNGFITSLAIMDRRWRWQYGSVSGAYNVRDRAGNLISAEDEEDDPQGNPYVDTERTPQALCEILLRAMGETDFDIDDVPQDVRPEVEWDRDNPASELARLCDIIGCGIVLQPDNRVAIRVLGQGQDFPPGLVDSDAPTFDPPEIPTTIEVISEPTQYQWDFELEAVGLDRDESIKLIDDLDITPDQDADGNATRGWIDFDPVLGFPGMDEDDRELAKLSVYRWYAIKYPFSYPDRNLPNAGEFRHKEEIVLLDRQVDERITYNKGGTDQKDPLVYGVWWDDNKGRQLARRVGVNPLAVTTKSPNVVPVSFTIEREKQIVMFSEPVYAFADKDGNLEPNNNTDADFYHPAVLRLRTSFYFRNPSRAYRGISRERATGSGLRTQPLIVRRRDIFPSKWVDFEGTTAFSQGVLRDNFDKIRPEMDAFLDSVEQSFAPKTSGVRRYIGIVPVRLDGALRQATYEMNAAGPRTTIQRHQDTGSATSTPAELMRHYERSRLVDKLIDDARGKQQQLILERKAAE